MDAKKGINEIFNGKFGKADELLIEDFLVGEEMSFFIISDDKSFKVFNKLKIIKEYSKATKEKIQEAWARIHHQDFIIKI